MSKPCSQLCALGLILAATTGEVLGCGVCITAIADSVLPPIRLWVLLAMTWFVSSGMVSSLTGVRVRWQPGILGSVAIAVGLWCLGSAILGLFIILILFVPSIRGFAGSLGRDHSAELDRGVRATRIIGWVHVVGIVCASVLMVHTHLTRTPEEYIAKWGSTTPGEKRLQELLAKEPPSLDAYRYIVRHGNDRTANKVAARIGEIGEPERDVPLLREALARLGGHGPFTSGIEAALKQLETRRNTTQQNGPASGSQPLRLLQDTNVTGAGSRR